MPSLILTTATRYVFPLLMLVSISLLLRGHNEPGGGFVGGLTASAAYILYALSHRATAARRLLRVDSRALLCAGLLVAAASALPAVLLGKPFMTSLWTTIQIASLPPLHLGTPLLFDVGVYLVVLGVTLTFILSLQDEDTKTISPPRRGGP